MDFITIKRTYGNPPNTDTASFGIDGKHEGLRVIGGLPHCSYIEPADAEAAKALLLWLLAWMAKHGATPEPIIVHVEGGLVQDVDGIPPGVTVEVWDYDVSDFATDDDMAEMETDDDDSNPFCRSVYTSDTTPTWMDKHGVTPAESDLLKACSLYPETPDDFDTEDGKAAYCDCVVEWINETLRPAIEKAKP